MMQKIFDKNKYFFKFAEYIIDSDRPVQQNSRYSIDIINTIFLMHYAPGK